MTACPLRPVSSGRPSVLLGQRRPDHAPPEDGGDVGLGCMRMSTDDDRNEEQALETIAAAAEAGITVFDTARAYGGQRAAARPRSPPCEDRCHRADRDQGRHVAGRRRLDPRRPCEGDSRRLRGEPRRSRRPADRPLPDPCAGPADTVAHLGACAGPARRRRPRAARRALEREPSSAGRGARARADHCRPGRAQPVRRPGAQGRRGRPLHREGNRRDRPLAARRAAPRGPPCARQRGARRDRGRPRRDAGRGRARLAARALPRRRRDPRRSPPGDRALGRPRRDPRPRE